MISDLNSTELLNTVKTLVSEERRITVALIDHLREVERRMLYADIGYSNLFEFCTQYLGLSEGSAQRRISAMRLTRDVPEARASLESGSLSLTNASKLHAAFRAKKKLGENLKAEEKKEILKSVTHLSQRACETKLFEIMPKAMASLHHEREKIIGADQTEIRLVVDNELHSKLQRLKELLSHSIPDGSYTKILEHLADQEIAKLEKKKGITASPQMVEPTTALVKPATAQLKIDEAVKNPAQNNKALPIAIRREVCRRSKGKCEYPECTSRYRLEIDHIQPRAHGGGHDPGNLRLLCRTHNQQQARALLGEKIMSKFIPALRI